MRVSFVACLALAACFASAQDSVSIKDWTLQDAVKVKESGASISKVSFKPSKWYKAYVPGTVLSSLVQDGVYPEPLYGENNRRIPESLCRTSYWYRAVLTAPKSFKNKKIWLNFEGINYIAEVWVNGKSVGAIKGAFARGKFDVTGLVKPNESSSIAVHILPPPHPGVPHEQSIVNGAGPNGGVLGTDGPTFVASIGWDWIPGIRDRNIGIWQGVSLSATGPMTIVDPFVSTKAIHGDSADLSIAAVLQNQSSKAQSGIFEGSVEGTLTRFHFPVSLKPSERQSIRFPKIVLDNPKLWWPNGYGAQNLYRLKLTLRTMEGVADSKTVQFGVRTMEFSRPKSRDLTVVVNGVPIFCKGGNWGMDEAMKRSPRARLEAQIRLHRDAHYTMIRNWVGQSTQEDFYDLCDRYGILVWDDFWLANPVDGPNPADNEMFLANAREKIVRFRNHPSIAIWCGRNEGDPPPALNKGLAKLTRELDGTRFYQPHSADYNGVSGYGPYGYVNPSDYFQFRDALHTEIGVPSIPTVEAIKAMMPAKDWWPINDDWAYHDFTRGAQGGDQFPKMLARRFGPVSGLADFVRKSQLVNYESHRAIYEGRNSRLFSPASGVLIWMSNPAQPSFVWQLYSYDLEPTAALFGTRKGCEPIHIQLNPVNGAVQLVNNTAGFVRGRVFVDLYQLDGSLVSKNSSVCEVAGSSCEAVASIRWPSNLSPVHFVKLKFRDSNGVTVSENFYWRSSPIAENNFSTFSYRELNSLPRVNLLASAKPVASVNGMTKLRIVLTNPSKSIALMAHLQLRRAKSGTRVLPAYFTDNYVSFTPMEEKSVEVEFATADLKGEKPVFAVDGWNVGVQSSGAIPFVLNKAAQPEPALAAKPRPVIPGVLMSIACGSSPADGSPFMDEEGLVQGGQALYQGGPIDLSGAGKSAAPKEIYESERWGEFTYTIPVPRTRAFTVRLHFAELSKAIPGQRKFNLFINDRQVLNEFEIYSEAGGSRRVLIKDFPGVRADAVGKIVLKFRRGSIDWPEVRAIQIVEEPTGLVRVGSFGTSRPGLKTP